MPPRLPSPIACPPELPFQGIFAPLVRLTRNVMGVKPFNKLRGKGIQLHSQVITEFCKTIGAPPKTRQALIKTAKDNGGLLGFLA